MTDSSLIQSFIALGTALAINAARRAAVAFAGYLTAALLLTASMGFLTLASYRAIAGAIGDIYAALIVGCAHLMLALIVLLAIQMRRG